VQRRQEAGSLEPRREKVNGGQDERNLVSASFSVSAVGNAVEESDETREECDAAEEDDEPGHEYFLPMMTWRGQSVLALG
jgi:hypothetical protein